MSLQITEVQESLANLIASVDSDDLTFKINGCGPDAYNDTESQSEHTYQKYIISDALTKQSVDWYNNVVKTANISDERRNTFFELATKSLMYHYTVCII